MIEINKDKTITVNGRRTFPIYMYSVCDAYYEKKGFVTPCDPSINKKLLFSAGGVNFESFKDLNYQKLYEINGVYFTLNATEIDNIQINSALFFGYYQKDEPKDEIIDIISNTYSKIKIKDPSHPVILNHWENMAKWSPYTDIITWDSYTINNTSQWKREDSIYVYEQWSEQNFFKGTSINDIGKPVWAVIQANGVPIGNMYVPTPEELRCLTYTAITMDVKGIGYWGYKSWGTATTSSEFPSGTSGLYNNSELYTYVKLLSSELSSLNDILVLPTLDYSWYYHSNNMVTFSKILTKTVLWKDRTNFNYILKKGKDNAYYLIIVNKDSRSITDVDIKVSIGNVKTIGLESDSKIINGNFAFTDSFDGYAVHIYKILF